VKRFSVLVSGGGTNLQALIDRVQDGTIKADIAGVISSREGVYALERAQRHGIKTRVISKKSFGSQQEYDEALLAALREDRAEFVVLAGFLSILGKAVVQAYKNRILNIHPALLPDFGGKGYYGLRVHEAVLRSGVKKTGATVHLVDEGTDTGPIVAQECVPVFKDDTPETLQRRVMQVEHRLLPEAVARMVEGRLVVVGDKVVVKEETK